MDPSEREVLALAYIAHYSQPYVWGQDMVLVKRNNAETQWAAEKVVDTALEDPGELWEIVMEVFRRDPPDDVLGVLAAGPLEDYLVRCGETAIERVERLAKADDKFRQLLWGVWQNAMPSDVWARLEACREDPGRAHGA